MKIKWRRFPTLRKTVLRQRNAVDATGRLLGEQSIQLYAACFEGSAVVK